jgi:hypothetical protein
MLKVRDVDSKRMLLRVERGGLSEILCARP